MQFLLPKDLIQFGAVDKLANKVVKASVIYAELLRLRFDKHLYRFDSYEIIQYYYEHGMINLTAQHRFDHYRAATPISDSDEKLYREFQYY